MAEAMDFKFCTRALRVSPDMTSVKKFRKRVWLGSHDPVNFWALKANTPK